MTAALGSDRAHRPLTARQVANQCGVDLKTVHSWVEQDLIAHFRTPGRHLRFRSDEVDAFVERHGSHAGGRPPVALVIGARPAAEGADDWLYVADPYEALMRAASERPQVVVLVSRGLGRVEAGPFARALAKHLRNARLVWVGDRVPRGLGSRYEKVSTLAGARAHVAR